jgi:hypothetical protein
MKAGRRVVESVHTVALALWLGALVMTAVSAATLFPTMHRLEPELPAYAGYTGPHWLIAGGHIVQKMFWACDVVQFAGMLIAGVTFAAAIMWFGLSTRRVSTFVRVVLLLALVGVLSYRLGFLEPEMTQNLRAYWSAAAAGDNATAARFKKAFDAGHPIQSRMLGLTAGLVLAALIAGIWSFARAERPDVGAGRDDGSGLEVPLLARGRR